METQCLQNYKYIMFGLSFHSNLKWWIIGFPDIFMLYSKIYVKDSLTVMVLLQSEFEDHLEHTQVLQ